MGSNWRPDDSFIDKEGGQLKGVLRVKDALKKHGIEARGIVTSRDEGISKVREELRRTHLPPGFEQWQLPVALGPNQDAVAFVTVGSPGAEIPEHSHKCDLFRIVVSGSVHHADKELTAGDWMYVKEGVPYALRAGESGCIIFHMYW